MTSIDACAYSSANCQGFLAGGAVARQHTGGVRFGSCNVDDNRRNSRACRHHEHPDPRCVRAERQRGRTPRRSPRAPSADTRSRPAPADVQLIAGPALRIGASTSTAAASTGATSGQSAAARGAATHCVRSSRTTAAARGARCLPPSVPIRPRPPGRGAAGLARGRPAGRLPHLPALRPVVRSPLVHEPARQQLPTKDGNASAR